MIASVITHPGFNLNPPRFDLDLGSRDHLKDGAE